MNYEKGFERLCIVLSSIPALIMFVICFFNLPYTTNIFCAIYSTILIPSVAFGISFITCSIISKSIIWIIKGFKKINLISDMETQTALKEYKEKPQ